MASCTIRRRDECWIEVVLPTPSYAGELGKAHSIMMGQLGLSQDAAIHDDAYEVVVGDDEVILRAKRPTPLDDARFDTLVNAVTAVLIEWDQRGDGGCSLHLQDRLRKALREL